MNNIEKMIIEINQEHMPYIVKILKSNAMHFINIEVADIESDMKYSTDFIIRVVGGNVAVRIRFDNKMYATHNKIYRDFTIRSKSLCGMITELDKIKTGYGRWYLYMWHRNDIDYDWMIIDLDILRNSGLLDVRYNEIPNYDGTKFIAIDICELDKYSCIINKNIRG